MKRFVRLYSEVDASNKLLDKLAALRAYFNEAQPEDAAWAVYFLCGRKLKRTCTVGELRTAALALTDIPEWLFEECYVAVGDLAETLARIVPGGNIESDAPLSHWVEDRLCALAAMQERERIPLLQSCWRELDTEERLVWNKLITGGFRVGVAEGLVVRALSEVSGVPPHIIAHRLTGDWRPTASFYKSLVSQSDGDISGSLYPFHLAHPLESEVESLGPAKEWLVEWKWDGARCQIIKRLGHTMLWSRGEEMLHEQFPELQSAAVQLSGDFVLDGEIVAWNNDRAAPFANLQRRLTRKSARREFSRRFPVVYQAFDLLERNGVDCRALPLFERKRMLEELLGDAASSSLFRIATSNPPFSWDDVAAMRSSARDFGMEGVMLKRGASAYGVGRVRGDWWKWKLDPYQVDAVLVYAQSGHGQRAGLFTDYTFALWQDGELKPFAKAYSGLTKAEIKELDEFVRQNTKEKFGPVRRVTPQLVFEIAFEGASLSSRHKSGVAVRFPRIVRWRRDKQPGEADDMQVLRALASNGEEIAPVDEQLLLFENEQFENEWTQE